VTYAHVASNSTPWGPQRKRPLALLLLAVASLWVVQLLGSGAQALPHTW